MGEKSAKIGLDNLYYALLTTDTAQALTYAAPVKFAGAIEVKVTAENKEAVLYADNALAEVASSIGKVTLDLSVRDVDLDTQAALLGHEISGGVMAVNANDVAPYVAVGFRALKANGKYRYIWLLKGKFAEIDETGKSKGESVEFQTASLKGTFAAAEHNGNIITKADEDAAGYTAAVGSSWFTAPAIEVPSGA